MSIKNLNSMEIKEFRPFAHYDQFLDCIRVYTHDRSVTEQRIDESITLFRCNHATKFDPKYVGFSLKGVSHALNEIGLPMNRAYKLAELIDKIVKGRPSFVNYALLEFTFEQGYKTSGDILIDFPHDTDMAA